MSNKKLVVVGNILSTLPALIVVPLVPFVFILIEGEGKIPGFFHEYTLRTLMLLFPVVLLVSFLYSRKLFRLEKFTPSFWISLCPFVVFGLIVITLFYGGIVLK